MNMTGPSHPVVTASVEVALEPPVAFEVFTEEIGRWWRPGPINWYDSARAVDIRFEPGVGGRWLEVYHEATGDVLEIGRITAWEPGVRLVLLYRDGGHQNDGTEVEVRSNRSTGGLGSPSSIAAGSASTPRLQQGTG
jgi:hypothetical protein